VKHGLPFLLTRDRTGQGRLRSGLAAWKSSSKKKTEGQTPTDWLLARGRPKSGQSLEETLSSALLVQDKELAGIVQEVDNLLKTIKTDNPETQAVSNALQRADLCAVKQSLLDRELQSLALTDDLTCLYNRRAFLALATQQLRLMRRKGESLLLFFADVDNFKAINDSFGHREGDHALVRAADALEKTFRDSDILARLGGDEFAVLALEASGEDQDAILSRLRENLRKSNAEEPRYELSLSVGAARLDPEHDSSLGELMERADLAMYREKSMKRHPGHFEPAGVGTRLQEPPQEETEHS